MFALDKIDSSPFSGLPTNIPALNELKKIPQWVAWRHAERDGRPTKLPVNPHSGSNASVDDLATWGTYEQAEKRAREGGLAGVGFVLSEDDNLTGYDFDKCFTRKGRLKPWAFEILSHGETYAEVSPSGRGIRMIARGKIATAAKCDPACVEMYGHGRYLTITGQHIEGTPDTIGPATNTRVAARDRAELHQKTWADLKRVAPRLVASLRGRKKFDREACAFVDETAPARREQGAAAAVTVRGFDLNKAPRRGAIRSALFPNKNPFFRNVNDAALQNLSAWVPVLFPAAKASNTGWRVASADLGRDLEEDLSFTSQGIKDFGVHDMGDPNDGKRSPIDIVLEHGSQDTAADAALWLCEQLGKKPEDLGWKTPREEEAPLDTELAAPPRWLDMSNWDHEPVPERKWAIRDRVPLNQAGLFSGEGGTGKSIIEMMKDVAHVAGKDWLGSMPEPGPAFYIGAEDDEDEIHIRLAAIAQHYGVTFQELTEGGLYVRCLLGEDATLCAADGKSGKVEVTGLYRQLYQAAGDIKPKSISIDTLSRAFAGNEIDRVQVYAFASHMQALAKVAGGAVTVLSHPSLAGMASGSGISGSTAWHAAFRFRQYLYGIKEEDGEQPDNDLRQLEFKKNQYGPMSEPILLRYQRGLFLPEGGVSNLDKLARASKVEGIFLRGLGQLIQQGRDASPAGSSPSFGPTLIAALPGVAKERIRKKELVGGMNRLLDANKIHIGLTDGPPSRAKKCLKLGPSQGAL